MKPRSVLSTLTLMLAAASAAIAQNTPAELRTGIPHPHHHVAGNWESAGDDLNWWPGFGGPGFDRWVFTSLTFEGRLIVGGYFNRADGVIANNIAAWDGEQWNALGTGLDGPVYALRRYDGRLYAAGRFDGSGGTVLNNIACWTGTEWVPCSSGLTGGTRVVWALHVWKERLVAAGDFILAGGVLANNIAAWNGQSWEALSSGTNSQVTALTEYEGLLIAAGYFHQAGGLPADQVAGWDGLAWQAFGDPQMGIISTLAVYQDDLLIGGGDCSRQGIKRWHNDRWTHFGNVIIELAVECLFVEENRLYVGGLLDYAGGMPAEGMAMFDGSSWHDLGADFSGWPKVETIHRWDDLLVVGGWFTRAGGRPAYFVATYDQGQWGPLSSGSGQGLSGTVRALVNYGGEVVAGGQFEYAGEEEVHHLAHWNGRRWASLGGGVEGGIYKVFGLCLHEGDLIVAGDFTQAGGVQAANIARWDGAAWSQLGSGTDGQINCLLSHGDLLIAGGMFHRAGGSWVRHLAVWNGSDWSPLGTGIPGETSWVQALGVYEDDLVVGGCFTRAGSTPVNNIARWDGTDWHPLGDGVDGSVNALIPVGGKLVVGGWFSQAGGIPARRVAAWTGEAWQAMGDGVDYPTHSLAVADGDLYAGTGANSALGALFGWEGTEWSRLSPEMGGEVLAILKAEDRVAAATRDGWGICVGGAFGSVGSLASYYMGIFSEPGGLPAVRRDGARAHLAVGETVGEAIGGMNPKVTWSNTGSPLGAGGVRLAYRVHQPCRIELTLHDVQGRVVHRWAAREHAAGEYAHTWELPEGHRPVEGIYFARLVAGDEQVLSRRLLWIDE